jgi:nucleoid-associated protein YgaU
MATMKPILILSLGTLILPHALLAASASKESEYQQVRTIALRDSRVQAAYRDADRRLDAKIIQIDPALEPYVKTKAAAREGTAAPKPAKAAPKPAATKPAPPKTKHVVAKGETLGSIASQHHVTVAALKTANHIQDERKLRVGQVLTIPAGKPAPKSQDEGFWSRLKHGF